MKTYSVTEMWEGLLRLYGDTPGGRELAAFDLSRMYGSAANHLLVRAGVIPQGVNATLFMSMLRSYRDTTNDREEARRLAFAACGGGRHE